MTELSNINYWTTIWSFAAVLILSHTGSSKQQSWIYQPLSVDFNTSDRTLLNGNLHVERISRGEFAISGKMDINIDENSNVEMEANSFYSISSNLDWKKLPFGAPRQPLIGIVRDYYKKFLMESLKNCSDMTQYKEGQQITIPKSTYTFNKCVISTERFPLHMRSGTYKLQLLGFGDVEFCWEAVIKIEQRTYSA